MKLNLNNFGKKFKLNKRKEKQKFISEEELFIDLVDRLNFCWDKSNKLYDTFKINILEYEEDYYQIIEDLLLLKYGVWKTEIILWYVFGRIDMDGKIYPLVVSQDGEEEEKVFLNNPKELWDFMVKLEKQRKQNEE
jgi:hypothetical protein